MITIKMSDIVWGFAESVKNTSKKSNVELDISKVYTMCMPTIAGFGCKCIKEAIEKITGETVNVLEDA